MKSITTFIVLVSLFIITSCKEVGRKDDKMAKMTENVSLAIQKGYTGVNGLKMYYEIYGDGKPLVLLHGGGSTIETTFGRIIPMLARHRKVVAVELQAHGRTGDREKDLSFEQDADDVASLLKNLNINKADFFGFSNGGTTAIQIAIRHPEIISKLVLGSALCKRNGVPVEFWDFMKRAQLANMPKELKEVYLKVASDPNGLQIMHDKDVKRVVNFKDIPDEQIKSIKAPTLIIIADKDVIKPEHAIEMNRLMSNSQLAIIPGIHGEYIEEVTTLQLNSKQADFVVPMIERFLDAK